MEIRVCVGDTFFRETFSKAWFTQQKYKKRKPQEFSLLRHTQHNFLEATAPRVSLTFAAEKSISENVLRVHKLNQINSSALLFHYTPGGLQLVRTFEPIYITFPGGADRDAHQKVVWKLVTRTALWCFNKKQSHCTFGEHILLRLGAKGGAVKS